MDEWIPSLKRIRILLFVSNKCKITWLFFLRYLQSLWTDFFGGYFLSDNFLNDADDINTDTTLIILIS